jgi:hypothetical protein
MGPPVSLSTREIEQRALLVPCPEHKVKTRVPCPPRQGSGFGEACMTRRMLADARDRLEKFPPSDELEQLPAGEAVWFALWIADAAQALSECVNAALGISADSPQASLVSGSLSGCPSGSESSSPTDEGLKLPRRVRRG